MWVRVFGPTTYNHCSWSFGTKKGNSRGAERSAHKVLREERETPLRAGWVIRGPCQRLLSQGLPTWLYVVVLLHVELRSAIDIRLPKHTHCASNVCMCVLERVCVKSETGQGVMLQNDFFARKYKLVWLHRFGALSIENCPWLHWLLLCCLRVNTLLLLL